MTKRFATVALLWLGLASLAMARQSGEAARAIPSATRASDFGSYPLDHVSRDFEGHCPQLDLIRYQGTAICFARPVRIYAGFAPHLAALERLVSEVATRHYGRPPARLLHRGAYNCRPIRIDARQLSEHGLGNALDVRGFRFDRLPQDAELPEGAPRRLRRAFEVTIEHDWQATRGVAALHAAFLADLRRELERRPEMFRGMLGPRFPGHHDHLHFDMAPWSLVYF